MTRRALILGLVLLAAAGRPVLAQESARVREALLMLRILAYDRNLKSRAGEKVQIAIVYRVGDRVSELAGTETLKALRQVSGKLKVTGLPVNAVAVGVALPADLAAQLERMHAAAVYLCPGVGDIRAITAATRNAGVLTFSASEAEVRAGLSVGLLAQAQKPRILVNFPASRAEGVAFESSFLRMAELLR